MTSLFFFSFFFLSSFCRPDRPWSLQVKYIIDTNRLTRLIVWQCGQISILSGRRHRYSERMPTATKQSKLSYHARVTRWGDGQWIKEGAYPFLSLFLPPWIYLALELSWSLIPSDPSIPECHSPGSSMAWLGSFSSHTHSLNGPKNKSRKTKS